MSFNRKIRELVCDLDFFIKGISREGVFHRSALYEKRKLETDFKNAKLLLGSREESAVLAGIHSMHEVGVEARKNPKMNFLVGKVHGALCKFMRNKYYISEGIDTTIDLNNEMSIKNVLIDVLFRNEGDIYGEYRADLSNVNLANCDLSRIDLTEAKLTEADLSFSLLYETNLEGADLSYSNFSGAKIQNSNFKFAKLIFTEMAASHILNSDFSDADMQYANLSMAVIDKVNFEDASFINARMSGSALSKVNFTRTDMTYAKLGDLEFAEALVDREINYLYKDSEEYHSFTSKSKLLKENVRASAFNDMTYLRTNLSGSCLSE